MTTEEWRRIPGFPDYEVSDQGRVVSYRRPKPRLLRFSRNAVNGYRYAALVAADGKPRAIHLHRLVLLTFVGPLPAGMHSRHLDGNTENNRLDNLTYGTPLENGADRMRHGTSAGPRGPRKIRDRQPGELTISEAAVALGYHAATVKDYVTSGAVPARKAAGIWLIAPDAVASWRRPKVGRPRKSEQVAA